MQDFDKN